MRREEVDGTKSPPIFLSVRPITDLSKCGTLSPTPMGRGPTPTGIITSVHAPEHVSAGLAGASSGHAVAQARYRARNLESERAKGRARMRRLRQKQSSDLQTSSSQQLRASKSFAAFRERVLTYPLWITTDDDKPEDLVEYQRFIAKISQPVPTALDDDEVDFLYRHVTPSPRTTFAAFREFVHENIFWLRVDDNDPDDVAAYEQFIENNSPSTVPEMSDDDIEFLFRHITPEPENMDGDADHASNLSPRLIAPHREDKQRELEIARAIARERMAKRRAAIKNLPPEVQKELTERARASRAKYRAQHRALLMQKEQSRRMRVFTEKHGWDEYIKRRRVRQSKSQSPPTQPPVQDSGAA
ncbi:hypothetical protein B0H11DRAFT_1909009 [Mycena galericulata]|nr:hypothetical protein B0H11DRAFT_1909009 [Mycena galericulata]